MPRQRTSYRRKVYLTPGDFPERLELFREESGLTWAEIACRLGVDPLTVRRWWKYGVRPNPRHMTALLELADGLGLGHLFTAWSIEDGMSCSDASDIDSERVIKPVPARCRGVKRKTRRPVNRLQARA